MADTGPIRFEFDTLLTPPYEKGKVVLWKNSSTFDHEAVCKLVWAAFYCERNRGVDKGGKPKLTQDLHLAIGKISHAKEDSLDSVSLSWNYSAESSMFKSATFDQLVGIRRENMVVVRLCDAAKVLSSTELVTREVKKVNKRTFFVEDESLSTRLHQAMARTVSYHWNSTKGEPTEYLNLKDVYGEVPVLLHARTPINFTANREQEKHTTAMNRLQPIQWSCDSMIADEKKMRLLIDTQRGHGRLPKVIVDDVERLAEQSKALQEQLTSMRTNIQNIQAKLSG